jgi:hypothetical protein
MKAIDKLVSDVRFGPNAFEMDNKADGRRLNAPIDRKIKNANSQIASLLSGIA